MITPAKILKDNFNIFYNSLKLLTNEYIDIHELHIRDYKPEKEGNYDTENSKKAIVHDLVRIYKIEDEFDISFSFDFLNKEPIEHSVLVSMRKNNETTRSIPYTTEEMGDILKSFNRTVKKVSASEIESLILKDIIQPQKPEKYQIKFSNKISDFIAEKTKEKDLIDNTLNETKSQHSKNLSNFNSDFENSIEFKLVEELKSKLDKAEKERKSLSNFLNKKYSIKPMKEKIKELKNKKEENDKDLSPEYKRAVIHARKNTKLK
jgi:hypothetical protein